MAMKYGFVSCLCVLLGLFAISNAVGQCPYGGTLVDQLTWLTPELPPSPPWSNSYPPLNSGPTLPAPCVLRRVNCNICPSTWRIPINTEQLAIVYMCSGNSYAISLCESTELWNSNITVTGASTNVVYSWDEDGCGTLDGHASLVFNPLLSGVYYVKVRLPNCAFGPLRSGMLKIECSAGPCPADGDDPCGTDGIVCNPNFDPCPGIVGAIPLTVASDTCQFVEATTLNYSATMIGLTPSCGGYPNNADIWFSTIVPADGNVVWEVEMVTATNLAMAVYQGDDCATNLAELYCNADQQPGINNSPRIAMGRPDLAVQEVFIRVWPQNNTNNGGTFNICARALQVPVNNAPCNAVALPVEFPCMPEAFTLTDALLTANISNSCGSPIVSGDVWFTAVVPESGYLTLELNGGSGFGMAAYDLGLAPCETGPFQEIRCTASQDTSGSYVMDLPYQDPGAIVHIRVWSRTDTEASGTICAYPSPTLVNDDPCGAILVEAIHGCLPTRLSSERATETESDLYGVGSIPAPSCGGTPNNDLWYKTTVPPNGALFLNMDDGEMTDAAFALYTADACPGNFVEIASSCTESGGTSAGAELMPAGTVTGLTPGSEVYIRVWLENGPVGTAYLCIGRTDPIPVSLSTCYQILNMFDSGGDGWGGSTVTINLNGVSTSYSLEGISGTVSYPTTMGEPFYIVYAAAGGFQNQISYNVQSSSGQPIYVSPATSPSPGFNAAGAADCTGPFALLSDCINSRVWNAYFSTSATTTPNAGNMIDLDESNRGCLINGEVSGTWYQMNNPIDVPLAIQIIPEPGVDLDFAIWGPHETQQCPPDGQPIRCSFATGSGPTGLNMSATDLSEGATGDGWVQYIDGAANTSYTLYVSARTPGAYSYTIERDLSTVVELVASNSLPALLIYPNPTDGDLISLQHSFSGPTQVRISDSAGRVVLFTKTLGQVSGTNRSLSIGKLDSGSYSVELLSEHGEPLGQARFVRIR